MGFMIVISLRIESFLVVLLLHMINACTLPQAPLLFPHFFKRLPSVKRPDSARPFHRAQVQTDLYLITADSIPQLICPGDTEPAVTDHFTPEQQEMAKKHPKWHKGAARPALF